MTHIEVFDPPMCCSSGGPSVDPLLAAFAADVEWLTAQGVTIARHNLSQDPQPFVSNTRVLDLMQREGTACLPIVLVDGTATARIRDGRSWRARPDSSPAPRRPSRGFACPLTSAARPVRVAADERPAVCPDARPVLHGQGRRRQNLAGLRDRDCRRTRAACVARVDRSRIESRRSPRRHTERVPEGRARRAWPVRAQHRPRTGRTRVSRARRRSLSRRAAGHRRGQHRRAVVWCVHRRDRRVR